MSSKNKLKKEVSVDEDNQRTETLKIKPKKTKAKKEKTLEPVRASTYIDELELTDENPDNASLTHSISDESKDVKKPKKSRVKKDKIVDDVEPDNIIESSDIGNHKTVENISKVHVSKPKYDYKGKLLYVKTPHASEFATQVEVLAGLISEVVWTFTSSEPEDKQDDNNVAKKKKKGGLLISDKDSSRTIYFKEFLDEDNFTQYYCKGARQEYGINMVILNNLLKSITKYDVLTIYVEEANKQYICFETEDVNTHRRNRDRLKLMDLPPPQTIDRDIEIDAKIIMPGAEFHKRCKLMSMVGEYVDIQCTQNNMLLRCIGDAADRECVLKAGKGGVTIDTKMIVQGIFELKNIVLFTKCANLCTNIQIYMKNDYPLTIEYTIATLGKLKVALAPIKVEKIQNMTYEDEDDDDISVINSTMNKLALSDSDDE